MKTILAHLEPSSVLESVLASALLVARRFGSLIEGLHVRPGQPDVIAAGADGFVAAAPDLVAGFEREAADRAERAREQFEAFMRVREIPRFADAHGGVSADWRIEASSGHSVLGSVGRVFDLIALGRPSRDTVAPSMAALETALFETGRPLLIAPPSPPEKIGEHVVIAWNCSTETARTVAFGAPFIAGAKKVTIVTIDKGIVPGPSGQDLARNLARYGIPVEAIDVPAGNRSVGEAMLEEAMRAGGDLLIKGAYTQSRLRQMIFGGATSHILVSAELPVLMAH